MKPEELLIIAKSVYPEALEFHAINGRVTFYVKGEFQSVFEVAYNPLANKAQEMDLVRAYREKLDNEHGIYGDSAWINERLYDALESPETLCQAYLKLIKGDKEGEAS